MPPCWTDDEAGWEGAKLELARIRRRVRTRWIRTLLITIAITALVVLSKARKQRIFEATVVYRVTEGDFDPNTAPPTAAKLKEYVAEISLSGQRLAQVMEAYKLDTTMLALDRMTAIDTMRDRIDVDVLRNYFSQQRYPDDPPRSARIAISFRGTDPAQTLEIARHLGALVAEQEMEDRKQASTVAMETANRAASDLREELKKARGEQARLQMAAAVGDPTERAMDLMRIRHLSTTIQAMEDDLRATETKSNDLELRSAFEGQQMGLRFELVDPGRAPRVLLTHTGYLIVVGFLVFFFLSPIVAIGVGAFDVRVYDEDDLRRLGIEPFGTIPKSPDGQLGNLLARLKADTGATCKT